MLFRSPTFYRKIYVLTAQIPAGQVATYSQLAFLAGSPRASRIAGCAMACAPAGLPCHRVLYRDGRLSPPDIFGGDGIQRQLLEQEGVPFLPDGRVDLRQCQWNGQTLPQKSAHFRGRLMLSLSLIHIFCPDK